MKQSKIEQVVAEMKAEKTIVDACILRLHGNDDGQQALAQYSAVLESCIARLSGNGTEAPKPARTRKSRKATEPTL